MDTSLPARPLALVIEDDTKLTTIFIGALTKAGFETRHAGTGRQALQLLDEIHPCLVLLDLHLPEVSGDKVLRHIRATEGLKDIVVILATADAVMADALEDKSDFVLQKPISFIQLRDLTERIGRNLCPDKTNL